MSAGRVRRTAIATSAALFAGACVRASQFERDLSAGQWTEAARDFAADSGLLNDEDDLYRAAVLFGSPDRPTYEPERARALFTTFLARFPSSRHAEDARAQLLLLGEVARARDSASSRVRALETRIAQLEVELRTLRVRADTSVAQTDSLRAALARADADRKDKEEQLRQLRLELDRLKQADLKPRRPPS